MAASAGTLSITNRIARATGILQQIIALEIRRTPISVAHLQGAVPDARRLTRVPESLSFPGGPSPRSFSVGTRKSEWAAPHGGSGESRQILWALRDNIIATNFWNRIFWEVRHAWRERQIAMELLHLASQSLPVHLQVSDQRSTLAIAKRRH